MVLCQIFVLLSLDCRVRRVNFFFSFIYYSSRIFSPSLINANFLLVRPYSLSSLKHTKEKLYGFYNEIMILQDSHLFNIIKTVYNKK